MKSKPRWLQGKKLSLGQVGALSISRHLEASALFNAAMRRAESRQQALGMLVDQSLKTFSADAVGVYHLRDNKLIFAIGNGLAIDPPIIMPADASNVMGRSLYLGRISRFDTSEADDRDCDFCGFLKQQGMVTLLIIPLETSSKTVGILFLAFLRLIDLLPEDEQLLYAYAESAGNTIDRFLVTEQLEQTVRSRDLELTLLYDLMEIAGATSEMNVLLKNSLSRILKAAECSIGMIHFKDPKDSKLTIAASDQFPEEFSSYLSGSRWSDRLWSRVYQGQEMIQVQNVPDRSSPENADPRRRNFVYLGIPIHINNATVGVLSLFGESDRLFNPWVVQMLTSATNVLGLTVENFYFRQQAEDAMILSERQRLGRNLHDSVSQSLYAMVISADVSEKLLRIKDYAGLRGQLQDLGKVAQQGLKDMRLMLYEFHPSPLEAGSLVKALDLRLNSVENRAGIDVELAVHGEIDLPPQMEREVYQIAIESLNNSLKHAEASSVLVTLNREAEKIILEIKDNGVGFDPSSPRYLAGGMGLESMRERATIIAGSITVDSSPGGGTLIRLEAPLNRLVS